MGVEKFYKNGTIDTTHPIKGELHLEMRKGVKASRKLSKLSSVHGTRLANSQSKIPSPLTLTR